ncbi:hypothetical protein ACVWXN_008460 [Bradyrhizobium sp. i1.4.4]
MPCPGVEHDGDVGHFGGSAELNDGLPHLLRGGVLDLSDLEIQPLQRAADVGRVASRVRQLGHLLVGAIADDKRNPRLRKGGLSGQKRHDEKDSCPKKTHQ